MSLQLRIERDHRGRQGLHLGSGTITCYDGETRAGVATYVYWDTPGEYRSALAEKEPPVEGPFFRARLPGHPIASVDIEIRDAYRKTPAFWMLMRAIDELDMPVYARFGNERLGAIFRERYRGRKQPSMADVKPGVVVVTQAPMTTREELMEFGSNKTLCGEDVGSDWLIYRHVQDPDALCDDCLYEEHLRSNADE